MSSAFEFEAKYGGRREVRDFANPITSDKKVALVCCCYVHTPVCIPMFIYNDLAYITVMQILTVDCNGRAGDTSSCDEFARANSPLPRLLCRVSDTD